jgi:hypothetical protein
VAQGGYRVEVVYEGLERIWRLVSPSGDRMYTYSDAGTAQAEAAMLNSLDSLPSTDRLRLKESSHLQWTGRSLPLPVLAYRDPETSPTRD